MWFLRLPHERPSVCFQIFDLLQHAVGAFVLNGAILGALAEAVCKSQAAEEVQKHFLVCHAIKNRFPLGL